LGMHLNATSLLAASWLTDWHNWGLIAQVAVGLGMVIFVHELGHFVVAKACGVKCEKFYLGFDIFGLKLARFRWGETEYGIGILPLGGYVKMLGQEDNPTKAAEEFERAKLARDAAGGDTLPEGEAAAQTSIFDPRSYLAKSVPKRMAIISAGVIMNVIFAFVVAVIAYERGVNEEPCIVGAVVPGDPAWRAGLRPGDDIVRIRDIENPSFRDLRSRVVLGSHLENGVDFFVRRPGVSETQLFTLYPIRAGLAPRVGIQSAATTTLADPPLSRNAPLGGKDSPLHSGDVVEAIAGVPVATNAELQKQLALHPGPAAITVRRKLVGGATEQLAIDLPGRPLLGLGLVMEPGPIVGVQNDSPAAKAGLEKGDILVSIDGQPVGDPETLNDRLLPRAGQTIPVAVKRGGKDLDVSITLAEPNSVDVPFIGREPLGIGAMGIALDVTNQVASVVAGSPAEKAGVKPGTEIVKATIPKRAAGDADDDDIKNDKIELEFAADKSNWPLFVAILQAVATPETPITLTLASERSVEMKPVVTDQWNPDRGFRFLPILVEHRATSLGDALRLATTETIGAVTQVYQFLSKIGTQISVKGMAGPLGILGVAHSSASKGFSDLLIFLGMLSANLAVLNFLPIPLLDGGHMVFLILEGIRGKPVSERVVIAFHYAGFLFIISLMAFVFLLDLHLIPRTP
jgi:regulator of sigma E protease